MATSIITRQRNLTLEICKLIAACFVVFAHSPFPGRFGEIIQGLAHCAVPLFFAISGWYSYRVSVNKLLRRMGHVLLLELVGICLLKLWSVFAAFYTGQDLLAALMPTLPSVGGLGAWLLWLEDPFESHLWYLSASAFCYGVFVLYDRLLRRHGYAPMYLVCGILLCANLAMDELSCYTGLNVHFKVPRNGLFLGLPMFSLGLLLREYREQLLARLGTRHLLILLVLGIGMSAAECSRFGSRSVYLGTLPLITGLLLLTSRHPGVPRWMERAAVCCGPLSAVIYLVHLVICDVYLGFVQWRMQQYFGRAEPWIHPLAVLAAAAAIGMVWQAVAAWRKRIHKG